MKKPLLLFILLAFGAIYQACDNSKTYAEMLADERKAINSFIETHNITSISQEEFEKDTITNVEKNEYVAFSNGVYMQIVDRGSGDSIKNRDEILVRFIEYDIMGGDTTYASNVLNEYEPHNIYPDAFNYNRTSYSSSGQFISDAGVGANMILIYESTAVPSGWLIPLDYVRDGAHVKLIVPSKMGHTVSQRYVYPYFYDIRKFQIR